MTYGATLSHLRRLIIPTGKEGKNTAMRQIHGSGFGFVCPCETPEGAKIGVVLNYALLTRITKKIPKVQVKAVIEKCRTITSVDEMNFADIKNFAAVILNGNVIGFAEDPDETVREIRNKRSQGLFNKEVSVSYDVVDNDIRIFCDEGRFTRPLLTLTDNRLNITSEERYKWGSLIRKGIVQYVDAAEIENCVIAMTHQDLLTQQNDFCEIHPSTMLGIMAAMIPFPDHSQSPRNCYQSSMGKQALGMPVLSYNLRTDTLLHVLHYPQRPLVCTKAAEIFKINEMPSGINAIVAIACYSGYNQEDSVMLNLSSIQRGMFCLTSYHTIDCSEKKRDTYSFEEICMPPKNSEPDVKVGQPGYFRRKNANYSLLDENGVIRPRERFENGRWVGPATVVKKGDVLIGKVVVTTDKSSAETKIDASVIIQPGEEGTIDRVHVVITPNGYKLVKIVIRVTREPTLGDKLASRAAQKGTIGMVYRQEDMPFTQQGITPDIIINPLCLGKDSHISLSDGTCERIDKIVKNEKEYSVRTVDPLNFQEKITAISDSFAIRPTKPMVSVKTWSGREIICTDDHQFLTAQNEWKKASELKPNQDMLTIVHCTKRLCEEGELPNLALDSIPYRKQLESFVLTERKLQILARLLGAIETDGHLCVRSGTEAKTMRYRVLFYIGEEEDANDMARDIISLGFPPPSSRCVVTQKDGKPYMKTWRVEAKPALGYILHSLGAHTGRKSVSEKIFPKWLINASKETKRQFLCGIQGGDGSYVAVNVKTVQQQIRIRSTKMTARNSVFDSHLEYMGAIQNLFIELGINCTIRIEQPKDKNSKEIGIAISVKMENLEKYTDLISYAYCNHKQRRSRLPIEFLRLRNRGIHMPFTKMQEFMRKDTVAMYVESVTSVPTENLVYDFATCADTHSFVANSIVVHNCMPSRMTINQLIECALGKECAINGTYGDATPFTTGSVNVADKLTERVGKNLHDYGFQAQGWETMYNGMTGEMINARIFIGPTYYQRLKHMVDDKMHARAQGHVTMLTRQPLEGRSRDGGLRFGEMERDCMIGHGDAEMLRERLFLVSDPFKVSVCNKCGVVTSGVRECQVCKGDQVSSCNIPYASKLLHQELTAMGLKMTIRPDEKSN
jgi:acid phosphatase class B